MGCGDIIFTRMLSGVGARDWLPILRTPFQVNSIFEAAWTDSPGNPEKAPQEEEERGDGSGKRHRQEPPNERGANPFKKELELKKEES